MPGLFSGGTTDVNTGRRHIASDGALQRPTVKMGQRCPPHPALAASNPCPQYPPIPGMMVMGRHTYASCQKQTLRLASLSESHLSTASLLLPHAPHG
jgi:hypothetical protein